MVLVVDMASVIILLDNVLAILGIKVLIVLVRFQIMVFHFTANIIY